MKEFWDKRYAEDTYAYGTDANQYLQEVLGDGKGRSILFPGEGEGRNALFAAEKGWKVTAFDQSVEARKKAMSLASKRGLSLDYIVSDFEELSFADNSFDAAVMIYVHFPANLRQKYHQKVSQLIKPGGQIIIEGFSKEHVKFNEKNPSAGGPKDIDFLFSLEELKADFKNFEIVELQQLELQLSEGLYHSGESSVIRCRGIKL